MKKGLMILGATVLSLSLTGCGGNDNAVGNNNNQGGQTNDVRPIANVNNNNENNNRTLRISDRAEKQVERLKEVDDAHVIISNNNAYVTVRLANDQNNRNNNNQGVNRNRTINNRTNENNNNNQGFFKNGTVDQNGDDGVINGLGDAGTRTNDNRTFDPGISLNGGPDINDPNAAGYRNRDNVANRDNADVRGGNANNMNNAGTRAGNNTANTNTRGNATNYSEVSNSFEQKVADQVRQADNKIHKVYVSVDPNLHNRMNTYAEDIRTNRNRDGLFDDFTNTMNDFFRGNNNR